MNKTFAKILAVIVVAGSLAIFWHAASMDRAMDGDNGMSASCLTVCLTGGDIGTAAIAGDPLVLAAVILIAAVLAVVFAGYFVCKNFVFGFFQKDRHRYLMKTMVMLR